MARLPLLPFSSMTFGTRVEADEPCTEFLESAMNDATDNEGKKYGKLNALVTKCCDGTHVVEHKRTSQDEDIIWLLQENIVNAQPPLTSVGYSKVSDECYNIFIFSHNDDTLKIVKNEDESEDEEEHLNWCAHLKYNKAKRELYLAYLRYGDEMKKCSTSGNSLMDWIISMLSKKTSPTPIYTILLQDESTVTVGGVELNFSLWRGMHQSQRWYESKGFKPKHPDEQETYNKQLSSLEKLTIKKLTHILLRLYLAWTYLESNNTDDGLRASTKLVKEGNPYMQLFQPLQNSYIMLTGSDILNKLKHYKSTIIFLLRWFGVTREDKCEAICYLVGDNKGFTRKLNEFLTCIKDATSKKLDEYPRNDTFTQRIDPLQELKKISKPLDPRKKNFLHSINELLELFEQVKVLSVPRELVLESDEIPSREA